MLSIFNDQSVFIISIVHNLREDSYIKTNIMKENKSCIIKKHLLWLFLSKFAAIAPVFPIY